MSSLDRRGETLSIVSVVLCLACSVLLGALAVWCDGAAMWGASLQTFGAAFIWVLVWMQLHQQRLVTEERQEVDELERIRREKLGGVQTIFEEEELGGMEQLAMGRRLRAMERFLIPVVALGVAAFYFYAGVAMLPVLWNWPPLLNIGDHAVVHARAALFVTGGLAFVTFMLSRYALGLSRMGGSSAARAGGNALFATSLCNLAIAVALMFAVSGFPLVEKWLAWVIGGLMLTLAIETVIFFILEFYRPRVAESAERPFYDSRVVGIISEPWAMIRNFADTINYQFGYEVSETWFYREVLGGTFLWRLLGVQALIVLAFTCVVVVPPGHQAVIEHFGRRPQATLPPGIHLTWFWPVDRATIIPVSRVRMMELGYDPDEKDLQRQGPGLPILWTVQHLEKEHLLLVGDRHASTSDESAVSLLNMNMPIQWRLKPDAESVINYHFQSHDVERLVNAIASRELTHYAAQADVLDLLGAGGIRAADVLKERIQAACDLAGRDSSGLGVEIVHVGLGGIHPPWNDDVAKKYEEVVSAYENNEAQILKALGSAEEKRLAAAGDAWAPLYEAIVAEEQARAAGATEAEDTTRAVQDLIRLKSGGEARKEIAEAERRAVNKVLSRRSEAEQFERQLVAYQAAPQTYRLRAFLRTMEEGLKNIDKYVVALKDWQRVTILVDLKPQQPLDILGAELAASEAKAAAE